MNAPPDRARNVRAMFARIASQYDMMNRLMTAGQDTVCRRKVVDLAQLPKGGRLLDLGAGTGDLALEALKRDGALRAVGGDFTLEMMRVGQRRDGGQHVRWTAADARDLPFPDETFDAVTSGYLLRNVTDLDRVLSEQYRTLKPGGRVVALDTTPPPSGLLRPFIDLHLNVIIPLMGRLIVGDPTAYTYLPESTAAFLPAEQLAARMALAGFREVGFRRLMFGVMAVHWGRK